MSIFKLRYLRPVSVSCYIAMIAIVTMTIEICIYGAWESTINNWIVFSITILFFMARNAAERKDRGIDKVLFMVDKELKEHKEYREKVKSTVIDLKNKLVTCTELLEEAGYERVSDEEYEQMLKQDPKAVPFVKRD